MRRGGGAGYGFDSRQLFQLGAVYRVGAVSFSAETRRRGDLTRRSVYEVEGGRSVQLAPESSKINALLHIREQLAANIFRASADETVRTSPAAEGGQAHSFADTIDPRFEK